MSKNRFSNEDDDDMDEEMEQYFDMDDLDDTAAFIDAAQMELVNREQDQNVLKLAVDFVSNSWFWKFRRLDTKLRMMETAYKKFINLLDEDSKES